MAQRSLGVDGERLRRNLTRLPGAFWLRDEGRVFAGAFPDARSDAIDPEPDLDSCWEESSLPRWIGMLPYEAFRFWERKGLSDDQRPPPLVGAPSWLRYPAVVEIGAGESWVVGRDEASIDRLATAVSQAPSAEKENCRLELAEPLEDEELHCRRIETALGHIQRGDLYQVNLARRFSFEAVGHPLTLLEAMGKRGQAPYGAAIDAGDFQVVSTSPELFLSLDTQRNVSTRPIKGTRPRHSSPEKDRQLAAELDASEKERAELAMVIDVERNDFGRLALPGTVQMTAPPAVVTHPLVHHREATIVARLRSDVSRCELLKATMPSGSVTGAPKVRAMELIRQLEAHRRGLYTGALGYLTHAGELRLSMAIRILVKKGERAHYFAGGGIVADSDPHREVEETLWKAEQVRERINARG